MRDRIHLWLLAVVGLGVVICSGSELPAFAKAQSGRGAKAPEAAPAREDYLEFAGARIWFSDSGGAGQAIVLVHPSSGHSRNWEYQLKPFSAAGYRVINYDRPGYGRTVAGPERAKEPGTAADDLKALLDHLGIDRAHFVGTSSGSGVALDFGLSYPQRVRTLVLCCTVYGGLAGKEFESMADVNPGSNPSWDKWPPTWRYLGASYRAMNPEGVRRWLALYDMSRVGEDKQRNKVQHTAAAMESLQMPVLLMTGTEDFYNPPPVARAVKKHIKNAELVILQEAGHHAMWEQPEAFNKAVLDFFRKH